MMIVGDATKHVVLRDLGVAALTVGVVCIIWALVTGQRMSLKRNGEVTDKKVSEAKDESRS
jgi:hypothetical protein